MKTLFVLIIYMSIHQCVFNQIVTVIDAETNQPLDMVTVSSPAIKQSFLTNAKGQVDIEPFSTADSIVFRLYNYRTIGLSLEEIRKSDFTVRLEPATFSQDEFVVSASRWRQFKSTIPYKVSRISREEMELLNPQTSADLLGATGEVFIQKSQQGGGSPMIRGFATNRLLYSVDGVRMNTAIFRGGNIQNVLSIDPFAIESTEILFGPGSVIYGSDAIGGVMSFQTLLTELSATKEEIITGKAATRFSSANNEFSSHFDVNVGWKKWAFLTSASYNKYGDLKMGSKGPDDYLKSFYVKRIDSMDVVFENENPEIQQPSGFTQMHLMQKVRYRPSKKWDFEYAFHYSETSEYDRYDRLIETDEDGLPISAVWKYGPQKWMMNRINLTHSSGNKIYDHLKIHLAHQQFEESRIDRKFNKSRLRNQVEEVAAYSANVDLEKRKGPHQLYYGLEAVLNVVESNASAINITDQSEIPVPNRYPDSEWATYAAYLNYHHKFGDHLILQTGARFTQYQLTADFSENLSFYPFDFQTAEISNEAVNGSLGLVYSPSNKWKIGLNASTAFRAPNVDDIGKIFDFTAGNIVVPNPDLQAEYAYNAEISVSRIFGAFMKLDLTGFYTYLDDAIVRRAYQVNGQDSLLFDGTLSKTFALQNAAYSDVYGFNATVEIKLPEGFGIRSNFSYQLGVEEMDDGSVTRSRHAAPWFGVTRLTYKRKRLELQYNIMYCGEIQAENLNEGERQKAYLYAKNEEGQPYSPGWYTLNFKAMYNFTKHFTVSGGVENITDIRYRPYSSGLAAAGRNFILSLLVKF
ncbi:MAG: TonB-dependent receptor [Brumimicrobium sp.]|nr:TonB-dependent receptor [Brumimicrobium sp.]